MWKRLEMLSTVDHSLQSKAGILADLFTVLPGVTYV